MAADNKSLGRFILDGIPPAPRGVPQVEVTFDIDASGILKVTAKDKASNKETHITISGAVGLSDEEVERMKAEAEKHKDEDTKRSELVNAKNSAETMIAASEKALKEAGDKAPEDVRNTVSEKIKNVKDVIGKDDASKEDIEKAVQDLSENLSKIGEAMYSSSAEATAD